MKKSAFLLLTVIALALASCTKDPTSSFSASSADAKVGEVVTFTDASTDGFHHVYDFGDGSEHSKAKNPTHVYWQVGTYTVTQWVYSKNFKKVAESTTTVTVTLDTEDQAIEDFEDRQEMFVGTWSFDSWKYEHFEDGTIVSGDTQSESYSSSSYNFLDFFQIIYTDEDGNKSAYGWNLIDDTHLTINVPKFAGNGFIGGVYEVATLTSSSLVITHTHTEDGFPPVDKDKYVNTYTFSK